MFESRNQKLQISLGRAPQAFDGGIAITGSLLTKDTGQKYAFDLWRGTGGPTLAAIGVYLLCGDGEEVIIPAPFWLSYPEMVRIAGGCPVVVDTDEASGLKMTPEQLKSAVTPKSRAVIINSPSVSPPRTSTPRRGASGARPPRRRPRPSSRGCPAGDPGSGTSRPGKR